MSKKYGMLQVIVEREYTQHIIEFDNNFRIKLIREASKLARVHVCTCVYVCVKGFGVLVRGCGMSMYLCTICIGGYSGAA